MSTPGINLDIFGPRRIAVQLDETHSLEFLSYWVRYNKPVDITFRQAHTPGLVAVTFTIDPKNYNAMEFMERAVSKTGGKIHELTKK